MCWIVVYVWEKDCLGVLWFDMFSTRQLDPCNTGGVWRTYLEHLSPCRHAPILR
jgi:hypothetical protein